MTDDFAICICEGDFRPSRFSRISVKGYVINEITVSERTSSVFQDLRATCYSHATFRPDTAEISRRHRQQNASRRVLIFLRCLCTAQRSKRLTEPTRARAARHRDKSSQRDCFARDAACRRKRRCESIADAEIRTAAGDQGSLFLAAAWRVLRSRHLTERQKSAFCSISD